MTKTNASNAAAKASNAAAKASNATAKPASNATAKNDASNAAAMPAIGALAVAFITFHKAEGENEKHLRDALKVDAGNIDLKPLAKGIILGGGAAWCKDNANMKGAKFFNRTIDAAKEAADEMGLETDARKGFMNPLRAKIQRAIITLSNLDVKAVKASAGTSAPKNKTTNTNPNNNQPAPGSSDADTDESAATVQRKIEHAALVLALETFRRLAQPKTAADKRDFEAVLVTLESLAA